MAKNGRTFRAVKQDGKFRIETKEGRSWSGSLIVPTRQDVIQQFEYLSKHGCHIESSKDFEMPTKKKEDVA